MDNGDFAFMGICVLLSAWVIYGTSIMTYNMLY